MTNGTAANAVVPGRSSSSSYSDEEENSNSYGEGDNLSCGTDEESPSKKNKTTTAPVEIKKNGEDKVLRALEEFASLTWIALLRKLM